MTKRMPPRPVKKSTYKRMQMARKASTGAKHFSIGSGKLHLQTLNVLSVAFSSSPDTDNLFSHSLFAGLGTTRMLTLSSWKSTVLDIWKTKNKADCNLC